jgi:leucyl aminopeptidase (aminopeptidase T)
MTSSAIELPRFRQAIEKIVAQCFRIQPGETVVVVGDQTTYDIAGALRVASQERGGDAVLIIVDEDFEGEPPSPVAAALGEADVFIVPAKQSLSHTKACKDAMERGARGATLPGVTADMLSRTMTVDFEAMRSRSEAVAEILTQGDSAHLICARGTDVTFDIADRVGVVDDADLSHPGAFANLPAGEGAIAPRNGYGTVAAMSVTPAGILPEPMMLKVEEGNLVSADGPHSKEFLELLESHGSNAFNLAELGVGTNDAAVLTGNVLEDEKVVGTAHVAFGGNDNIGGTVYASIHRDVMVFDATLDVGGTRILDAGKWMLEEHPRSKADNPAGQR